jgi:hypothetical protein
LWWRDTGTPERGDVAVMAARNVVVAPGVSTTSAVVERTGIPLNTLNRYVRRGYVSGPGLVRGGSGSLMWWRDVDEAAAVVVASFLGESGSPSTLSLARLAARAVETWWGAVPFVVLALPDTAIPCLDAEQVDVAVRGMTVATVIRLAVDA